MVVNAVVAGGRVEAEPCGSCRLVAVCQRRQASSTATLHIPSQLRHGPGNATLSIFSSSGEAKVEVYCFLKVASNTIHSSSSSREQQSL